MTSWENQELDDTESAILYICLCLGLGGVARYLLKNFVHDRIRFPYSAVLIVLGIIIGLITLQSEPLKEICVFILRLNAIDLVAILFPPFIFKTAFRMDIHIFLKSFTQILTISILGFALSCAITGFFIDYLIGKNWPIVLAIILGLAVSLTDTKDTSKFLGQFKNFGVLLAGEEMITSSLSLFLYNILIHLNSGPLKADPATLTFYKMAVPVVTGFIIGKLFVYFVSADLCDFYTNVTASLFIAYSMFYVVEIYLGASGVLTLLVFGVMICCHKKQISGDLEQSLVQFWELVYNIFNFILYIEAGIFFVRACQSYGEGSDVVRVFMTYLICIVARSLMFLVLSPILSRIGYGLNWKNGAVLVWGALKGTPTIVLASCVYLDSFGLDDFSNKTMIYAVGLVLMQLIINGTTIEKMVKVLGFMTVSVVKISNMNSLILHVMSARDKSINMLKMNRFFADASWDTVRNATKIVHPYKDSFTEKETFHEDDDRISGVSKCPDCKKEIQLQPTAQELREIKKEAYLRILTAKKVSYWRQFEWGMMTKEANRILVGAVDDALEKNLGMVDVDVLRNLWKPKGCTVNLRNKLVKFMPNTNADPQLKTPLRRWQFRFYKIVSSLWWEYGTFLLVMLNIISIILDFIYRPAFTEVRETPLLAISTTFFIILTVHIVLKILGVGCYNFMRSAWHFIDMLTIIITLFYIFYIYKYYVTPYEEEHLILLSLSAARGIYIVRLLRIYDVARATIPKIVEYLDRKIDVHLAHGYDVGKGFVTGENEVLKLLPKFVGNKKILAEIKIKMEADRLAITKEIGILQRNRPTIAITVKTKEAMGVALYVMKESTKELRDGGLLDDEEYELLSKAIEDRQKFIRKHYLTISPCPPDVLLRQVPWVIDDEETANFLVTHSSMVNLNYEEILIKADEEPQGIYVLVSGLVRMTYELNVKKLEKLEQCGALPNVDYPTDMNYRENQEDYIVSGNVIGEIGILTGRTYDASITCESSVQAYFISIDVMNYAMKSQIFGYTGLEQRIWKAVSVRLACIILHAVPAYQSWTQEKIQIHLERSFVPKLNATKPFFLTDKMEAVLLIEGRAFDVVNKDIYFAPSYIPRTVRKLTFATNVSNPECRLEPIFLIVPAEDVDEQDLLERIEGESRSSSLGSLTQSSDRKSKPRQKKRAHRTMPGQMDKYSGGVRAMKVDSAHRLDENELNTLIWEGGGRRQSVFEDEEENEDEDDLGEEEEEESGISERKKRSNNEVEKFGRKKMSSVRDEAAHERDSLKSDTSELSEEDKDAESYTLSYFNYKPLFNINFDESDEDGKFSASDYTDGEDPVTEVRGKKKVVFAGDKRHKGEKRRGSKTSQSSKLASDSDEEAGLDYMENEISTSSPRPGTSKSKRNRKKSSFK